VEVAVTLGLPWGLAGLYLAVAGLAARTAVLQSGARRRFWALVAGGMVLQAPGQLGLLGHLPLELTALSELAGFGLFAAALLVLLLTRRPTIGLRRFLDISTMAIAAGLLAGAVTAGAWPPWSLLMLRVAIAPLLVLGLLSGAWTLAHDANPERVRLERRLVLVLLAAFVSSTAFLVAIGPLGDTDVVPVLVSYGAAALGLAILAFAAVQDRSEAEPIELDPRQGPQVWAGAFAPDALTLLVVLLWLVRPAAIHPSGLAALVACYVVRQIARMLEAQRVRRTLIRDTQQTSALLEIARTSSTELDLERVLNEAVRVLSSAVGLERATVWLLEDGSLRWAAAAGYPAEVTELLEADDEERFQRLREALDYPGPTIRHGPLTTGPSSAKFATQLCVLCPIPAPAGVGGALGVLMLSTAEPEAAPDDSELTIAAGIAQLLGQTVANQQLLTRLRDEEARLRELTETLLASQEQERIAVSNAIHDDAVQLLSATAIQVEVLARSAGGDGPMAGALTDAAARLQEATVRMRDLMTRLRPPQLDDLGLAAAIESEAQRWAEETGIRILVAVADDLPVDPVADTVLFRTVQESLRNACRHAHARLITVRVTERHGRLVGEIHDDGRGIDHGALERAVENDHIGVQTMHEQVRLAGGTLQVDGKARPGTRVTVTLPVEETT
jgi:signal transduction histidine kinase